jgi:16S rRNA G1207 methylase RsmC
LTRFADVLDAFTPPTNTAAVAVTAAAAAAAAAVVVCWPKMEAELKEVMAQSEQLQLEGAAAIAGGAMHSGKACAWWILHPLKVDGCLVGRLV